MAQLERVAAVHRPIHGTFTVFPTAAVSWVIFKVIDGTIVFSRAKEMDFFAGAEQVDYDLLKTIQEHVAGYEVDQVPLWQWEEAILEGYRVFRLLRDQRGGLVVVPKHVVHGLL